MGGKINNLRRETVEPTKRRAMTDARRDRIFKAKGRKCYICGDERGPFDIEHPVPLALGGSDDDADLFPVCAPDSPSGCHKIKTKLDISSIAKAKRLARREAGEAPPSRNPIKSAGFAKGPKRKIQSAGFPKRKKTPCKRM